MHINQDARRMVNEPSREKGGKKRRKKQARERGGGQANGVATRWVWSITINDVAHKPRYAHEYVLPCHSSTRPRRAGSRQAAPFVRLPLWKTVESVENSGRNARSGNNLMTRGANGSLKHPHKFTASFQKHCDKMGGE